MSRVARRERRTLAPVIDLENGPTDAELSAIEAEMPLILAELAVVDAETVLAVAPGSEVARHRYDRAVRNLDVVAQTFRATASLPLEVA